MQSKLQKSKCNDKGRTGSCVSDLPPSHFLSCAKQFQDSMPCFEGWHQVTAGMMCKGMTSHMYWRYQFEPYPGQHEPLRATPQYELLTMLHIQGLLTGQVEVMCNGYLKGAAPFPDHVLSHSDSCEYHDLCSE